MGCNQLSGFPAGFPLAIYKLYFTDAAVNGTYMDASYRSMVWIAFDNHLSNFK